MIDMNRGKHNKWLSCGEEGNHTVVVSQGIPRQLSPGPPPTLFLLRKSPSVSNHSNIPGQIQSHFGFDFPSHIFVCSDNISVLFPGHLPLLSSSEVFHNFFFLFCFVRSILFITRIDYYWTWTRRLLTIKQPSWSHSLPKPLSCRTVPSRSLKRPKSALLKTVIFIFSQFPFLRVWSPASHGHCINTPVNLHIHKEPLLSH